MSNAEEERVSRIARGFVEKLTSRGELEVSACSPSAMIALAPDGPENGPRVLVSPTQPRPQRTPIDLADPAVWLCDTGQVVIAGAVNGSEKVRTFAATITVRENAVHRFVEFQSPREFALHPPQAPQGSGVEKLGEYFEYLDRGNAAKAAAQFSEDCVYSHPPYLGDVNRTSVIDGRKDVNVAFNKRGKSTFEHHLLGLGANRRGVCAEGIVPDVRGTTGTFISLLQLDAAGLISRYMAFYTEPGIP